ncbi:inactive hydroxysteroid dehydrogenase-like protein 1 [Atheta coriaria]|uniref:inactive hydroxysteroid dehydrogenase-like protein 1 n=1 Tax=Dalotia coriaria TaxID=877792 RepID=UPI0031F430EC
MASVACDVVTVALAFLGAWCLFCFLKDTLVVLLQTVRGHLAPYLLAGYEESTVKRFGEWALVTGCTDGIGKEYARQLASRGHSIILVSRTESKLQSIAQELEQAYSVKTKMIQVDFSEGRTAIEKVRKEVGNIPVSVLVNNVGAQYDHPMYVGEVPEHELWNIVHLNVGALTMLTRIFINDMLKRQRGAIVNVSSGAELQPLPLMASYAASKAYVKSFTQALQYEYRRSNLTIQHLSPMFINTKMNQFSKRLQKNSFFVPDAKMYAEYAVSTLGKVDHSTGYWTHGIQCFFTRVPPSWLRLRIGGQLNATFRRDYFKSIRK